MDACLCSSDGRPDAPAAGGGEGARNADAVAAFDGARVEHRGEAQGDDFDESRQTEARRQEIEKSEYQVVEVEVKSRQAAREEHQGDQVVRKACGAWREQSEKL